MNFDRKESVSMCHRALTNTQQPLLDLVGLTRFELVTPRLSSVCSNQLSYRPQSPVSRLRWPCQLRRGSPALADQPSRRLVQNTRRRPVLSKLDRRASFDNLVSTRSILSLPLRDELALPQSGNL